MVLKHLQIALLLGGGACVCHSTCRGQRSTSCQSLFYSFIETGLLVCLQLCTRMAGAFVSGDSATLLSLILLSLILSKGQHDCAQVVGILEI